MHRTLVTGAAGFIGSAVVRKLVERGREVRCLAEPGAGISALQGLDVECVEGDIRSRDDMRSAMQGVSVVYHLAALFKLWLPDSRLMYEVNVEGSKNLLFAAMAAGVDKVVFTSSIAAVGQAPAGQLADENTPFGDWDRADHYIRSKWLSERDALRFAGEGLPVVVVNPAFPFGVGDRTPTPTGRFILDALRGMVPGYPPGGFNAVDVEDVAEAHILAESRGRVGERYILGNHNVSYGDFYSALSEVAGLRPIRHKLPKSMFLASAYLMETLADVTKRPPRITYKAAHYATREHYFDTHKAREELGMPQTSLHDTIEKAVRWFRENGTV
jgi:dihydroflavonol-4-reductase